MEFNFNKFDPSQMKMDRMAIFIGKAGSGKTTLLKDVCYHYAKKCDLCFVLCGTDGSKNFFKEFIPEAFIYDVSIYTVRKIVKLARLLKEKNKERHILMIMDDFLGYDCNEDVDLDEEARTRNDANNILLGTNGKEKKKKKQPLRSILDDQVFRDIAYNQRQFNFSMFLSVQYCMEMKQHLRSAIAYCFLFQEKIKANKKRLHEYFFSVIEDYRIFSKILYQCTRDYECLVLDNVYNGDKIEDSVYFYKADPNIPNFVIGKPCYYKLAELFQKKLQDDKHLYENLIDMDVNNGLDRITTRHKGSAGKRDHHHHHPPQQRHLHGSNNNDVIINKRSYRRDTHIF